PSSRAFPSRIDAQYAADASATDSSPGVNAFGDSIVEPPIFAALIRIVSASLSPPFDATHSSVWSRTANTGLLPLIVRADEVFGSIRPRGRFTNVSSGSRPGYSSCTGPSSISSNGTQVFLVWSSDTAALCTSGVRTVAHGLPTGWPSASHPSGTTGPSASAIANAARNGDLPHPRGREITPRRRRLRPVRGSSS